MSPIRTSILVVASVVALAACAGSGPTQSNTGSTATSASSQPFSRSVSLPSNVGPGDTCADAYVIVASTARTNFQLGSEYHRTLDYCRAYPYLKWLIENEPLFTNETPDDRTYLRMAGIYEWFSTKVDSTNDAERRAYLDSALSMRKAGPAAMDEAGVSYDRLTRVLRDGFFFVQHAAEYEDSDERQFEAFNSAFEASPDSLDDWYLDQLFVLSGTHFADDIEARAAYIKRLAPAMNDPAKQEYFAAIAESLLAPPPEIGVASDVAVEALLTKLDAGTLSGQEARTLLATALSQADRVEALGRNTSDVISKLTRLRVIEDDVDDPRTLFALALRAYSDGSAARGNELFNRSIARSGSNSAKADLYYLRCQRGYGNCASDIAEVLRLVPNHAQGRYKRATMIADAVGRPRTTEARAAYWCLADIYREVAASVTDARVANAARSAAASFLRAAPTREQYFLSPAWEPGQTVTASLGAYGTCTTRVR